MTVLMMISLTVVAIYAYVMRRLWIKSWFREVHSNTFLKKLKSEASKIERITGFYLLRAEKRKRKQDRLALYIIHADLVSIPLFAGIACLYAFDCISEDVRNLVFAVLAGKDLLALLLQLIIMKFSPAGNRKKR